MLISLVCNGLIEKGWKVCKVSECALHLRYQASHKRSPWSDGKAELFLAERRSRPNGDKKLHCRRAGDWAERLSPGSSSIRKETPVVLEKGWAKNRGGLLNRDVKAISSREQYCCTNRNSPHGWSKDNRKRIRRPWIQSAPSGKESAMISNGQPEVVAVESDSWKLRAMRDDDRKGGCKSDRKSESWISQP